VFTTSGAYPWSVMTQIFHNGQLSHGGHRKATKDDIIDNHMSVLSSFGLSMKVEDCDLPLLYWIPKLHTYSYNENVDIKFIAHDAFLE
jgi:hypothetical protein